MIRATFLLLVAVAGAAVWEHGGRIGFVPTTGEVHSVRPAVAGRGGDGKAFTIRYSWSGAEYRMETRRGIVDGMGRLSGLSPGDPVPLVLDPRDPAKAFVDTPNARYPLTFSLIAVLVIFGAAWSWMLASSRLRLS